MTDPLHAFIEKEKLPDSYLETINRWIAPLANQLATEFEARSQPLLIGVNGAQGTGKTTFAGALKILLESKDFTVATLSLDDVYLTRIERKKLAKLVHPLLETRGVPGTHDVDLALKTINDLKTAALEQKIPLPRFDKAQDDRLPESQWPTLTGPADIILFEGWCMCAPPQSTDDLNTPMNTLEAEEDADGTWRHYVNRCLEQQYAQLFSQIDKLIMLKAPSFEIVFEWRSLQEKKLADQFKKENTLFENKNKIMDEAALKRFINHYERLTRHCLAVLPEKSDCVFTLDDQHQIIDRQTTLST